MVKINKTFRLDSITLKYLKRIADFYATSKPIDEKNPRNAVNMTDIVQFLAREEYERLVKNEFITE